MVALVGVAEDGESAVAAHAGVKAYLGEGQPSSPL